MLPCVIASFTSLRAVLSNRQFSLLWGGQTVSQFGDGIISVALPLLVLEITRNAADLGLVVAARLVPTVLLLLLGGAVTDRVSRRLAMLTSDGSRAAITVTLGLLALSRSLNFTELLIGSILFGAFDALFYPASTALLPELITAEDLTAGNSLSRFSGAFSGGLLGPIAGGVIASTIGTSWSLIVDAGTFVFSAGCLIAMRPTPTPAASGTTMLSEIRGGLTHCRRTPWILWSIAVAGLANAFVFSPSAILLPLLFKRTLHASNFMVGAGFAAVGLGGLTGALLMIVTRPLHRRVRTMWLAWGSSPLVAVLFGLSPDVWVAVGFAFVVGLLLMVGNVIWQTLMQSEVPSEVLGRVSSVDWMVSLGLSPVGVAAAGVVAGLAGIRATIVVPGVVIGVTAMLVLVVVRSITDIDRRSVLSGATSPDEDGPDAITTT
ncbi:MAG: MFS transporter [Acidobacteria bacterium]|nr:MFS transporter [Acidobacteriota bacterium]